MGDQRHVGIDLPLPARKTIDLEGRKVKDGISRPAKTIRTPERVVFEVDPDSRFRLGWGDGLLFR